MFYSSSALFLGTGINLFSQKVGITFLDLTTVRIRGEAGMNTDLLTKKLTARSGSVLNFTDPASLDISSITYVLYNVHTLNNDKKLTLTIK